jgi:hypothetical protein
MRKGIEFGRQLTMKRSDTPDVNTNTFAEDVQSSIIPHVMKVSGEEKIEQEQAVLLIDNCPSYITAKLINLLTGVRVKVATFAPRTAPLFQAAI